MMYWFFQTKTKYAVYSIGWHGMSAAVKSHSTYLSVPMKWPCVSAWFILCAACLCAACKSAKTITTNESAQLIETTQLHRSGIITVTPSFPFSIGDLPLIMPQCSVPVCPAYTITYQDTTTTIRKSESDHHTTTDIRIDKEPMCYNSSLYFLGFIIVIILVWIAFHRFLVK